MRFSKLMGSAFTAGIALAFAVNAPAWAQEAEVPQSAAPGDAAAGPPATIPTKVFAGRSPLNTVPSLSPDGRHMVYSLTHGSERFIGVWDFELDGLVRKWPLADDQELEWHRWAGSHKVLFSISVPGKFNGIPIRVSRLLVADVDTGSGGFVGNQLGLGGEQVVHIDPAGEYVLLSVLRNIYDADPEVWRFELDGTTTKGERVENHRGVQYWIADDSGVLRVGLGIEANKLKVYYRKTADEKLRLAAKVKKGEEEELWDVVRLISGSDEGYVLEPGESGKIALRRFNYATREVGEVVYENPEWDLTDFDLDRDGEPYMVSFTDETDRVVWLDPKLAKLQEGFEKALGEGDVWISGVSRDESRMLVWQGSAGDPGALYVYTAAKSELALFTNWRPDLDHTLLAPVKPIAYDARDGTRIRGYLTLPRGREPKALPLVVMPHGGPYGVRDKLDYDDWVQLLANRGYAVLQPNYRGSGGFGEAFEKLGDGEIGRKMQDDIDDAMDWAVAEGIADPARVCIVGASYGGYAALWGVLRNPERYRCAASWAGVTDYDKQLKYNSSYFDRQDRRAWKERVRGVDRKFDLDSVSPLRRAESVQRPILLGHGKKDGIVLFDQFEMMKKALDKAGAPGAEYLVLDKSGHGFGGPEDEQAWYDALVAFLGKHNPAD